MSVDDSKLNYYSGWDIDQLVYTGVVPVGSGVTAIFTIPAGLPSVPVFEVQFQQGSVWYQAGQYSTDGTFLGGEIFYPYMQSNVIYINAPVSGNARYFVWSDTVIH
jgi:hypothetical protein